MNGYILLFLGTALLVTVALLVKAALRIMHSYTDDDIDELLRRHRRNNKMEDNDE